MLDEARRAGHVTPNGHGLWPRGSPFADVDHARMNADGGNPERRRQMLRPAIITDEEYRLGQQLRQLGQREPTDQVDDLVLTSDESHHLRGEFLLVRAANESHIETLLS